MSRSGKIDVVRPTVARDAGGASRGSLWRDPGLLAAMALLGAGSFVALSIDVPRTLLGIKGDEATYVAMALSLAHDGDLVYERRDEERFFSIYNGGPSGIYLKKGVRSSYAVNGTFPYIHRETYPDGRSELSWRRHSSSSSTSRTKWVASWTRCSSRLRSYAPVPSRYSRAGRSSCRVASCATG